MPYKSLQESISYSFKNIELLDLAFIHKSFDNNINNERLEFLGDSILNSVISQYLFLKFPNEKEGLLTRMRAHLVRAESLTRKAEELLLEDYIKLSKGTANLSRDRKNSILEDSFEALIGSIFLDSGWDQVNMITLKLFNKELLSLSAETQFKDSKTELQELLQSIKLELPKYIIEDTGKGFNCSIEFKGNIFIASGPSKRVAETSSASKVLLYIKEHNE
ncbi:MAG: ribonuclease-3 [Gammaproteobacteria bacterium]|jgi:ribonuclease-3|tara:strand:+ start:3720 stop:4379 length:660 start_codon:yes stop_codon:yes gene_type:complete